MSNTATNGFNWHKVVVTGNVIHAYQSGARFRAGHKTKMSLNSIILTNEEVEEKKRENQAKSCRRAKQTLIDLYNTNFHVGDIFLTLTFKDNVSDRQIALYEFKKFIQRLRYRLGDFDYIAVPELQKRGAYHFHLVFNPKRKLDVNEVKEIWGNGNIDMRWIKPNPDDVQLRSINSDNVGVYIAEYISKDFNWKPEGSKAYLCSKGLQRPEVLRGKDAKKIIDVLEKELKPVCQNSYETPQGMVIYVTQYNLKRPEGGFNYQQQKDKQSGVG